MKCAYLSLGSNLGDKRAYIEAAIAQLEAHQDIAVSQVSSYYLTEPIDCEDQDWFLNAVLKIKTRLTPETLLATCLAIERNLFRKRRIRLDPRTLDIDILLYEQIERVDSNLTLPHPKMHQRAFVMVPLAEIEPHITIRNQTAQRLARSLHRQTTVRIASSSGIPAP